MGKIAEVSACKVVQGSTGCENRVKKKNVTSCTGGGKGTENRRQGKRGKLGGLVGSVVNPEAVWLGRSL